jgi:glycosyltransferase involved in cell wall biosynthesis
MRVALVENHVDEVRMSMRRFATSLRSELEHAGVTVEVLAPTPLATTHGLPGRARSVADKLLFDLRSLRGRTVDIVHVVDQGDAGHLLTERGPQTVVTCHDISVLTNPTFLGAPGAPGRLHRRLLLSRMRQGLNRADALVCDSEDTLRDVNATVRSSGAQFRSRIYLPLRFPAADAPPRALPPDVAALSRPYLFHIGNNGYRKNRWSVLEVAQRSRLAPAIVFAGEQADRALMSRAQELGVAERILSVASPDDELLAALYRHAHCLLFPSTFEGFGWPILEAQACGCPVVASNVTSLPEVARAGALLAAPNDYAELSAHVDALVEPGRRAELIVRGKANAALFAGIDLGREYIAVYERLLAPRPRWK